MSEPNVFTGSVDSTTITQTRGQTHGSFVENARVSQDIKRYLRTLPKYEELSYIQMEALDNIAIKISRIMSGGSWYSDNWDDIQGYARLAADETRGL